jgi:copper(I)-binding protein
MKRQKQIAVGDTLTITLHFADGRTLDVAFHVQGADTQ